MKKGWHLTEATKARQSRAKRGENNPSYGTTHTAKARKKMQRAAFLRWADPVFRARMAAARAK